MVDLKALREMAKADHEDGFSQAVSVDPADILALLDVVEAAQPVLQAQDGLPMTGIEATRRAEALRIALAALEGGE